MQEVWKIAILDQIVVLSQKWYKLEHGRRIGNRTKLSNGVSGHEMQWVQWRMVEYRTRNREVAGSTHTRSTASNLEQVANLLYAQANSASYPQRDGKWVVATATGWRPSVADWGDGVSASCTVGPIVRCRGQWMATLRCGTIGSCQSADTSEIVKRYWSQVLLM